MAWQERLLFLSELKEDCYRGGKLTEKIPSFVSVQCQGEKKEEVGEEKCSKGLF